MFLILEITENALLQKYELISVWFWMQNLNCSELINCITTLLLKSGIGHIYNNVEQCILQPKYYYQLQACSVHITTIEWKGQPRSFYITTNGTLSFELQPRHHYLSITWHSHRLLMRIRPSLSHSNSLSIPVNKNSYSVRVVYSFYIRDLVPVYICI